jgi:hypothetical protein
MVSTDEQGNTRERFGPQPKGRLIYGPGDYMAAQLGDARRPRFRSEDQGRATDAEVRAAFQGYSAYFGTYSVDPARGIVIHHVECALFPNRERSDLVREYRFDGDTLTLSTLPVELSGVTQRLTLVWQRDR